MPQLSLAISAFGTVLRTGDGLSPQTYTVMGELRSLSGPKISVDALETTTHNSPSRVRRYVPGLTMYGDVSGTINFSPDEPTHGTNGGILYLISTASVRDMQIVFPNDSNSVWSFQGFYTSFEVTSDPAALLSASFVIRIAGGMSFS